MKDNKDIENSNEHIPKVSIGMPVYNGEKHIREAVDSLLAQTFIDFELIISDNASTDNTEAICREYMVKDSRIRYMRQLENHGAEFNFKFVLSKARGFYFMWAAHDDRWENSFVRFCVDNIGKSGSIMTAFKNKNRKTGIIVNRDLPVLSGVRNSPDDTIRYLKRTVSAMFYGLHVRSNILFILDEDLFDWFDCFFCLKLIHDYGFKTCNSVNLFCYCVDTEKYVTKPKNGKWCNPFYYYFNSLKYIVYPDILTTYTTLLHTKSLLIFLFRYTIKEFFSWGKRKEVTMNDTALIQALDNAIMKSNLSRIQKIKKLKVLYSKLLESITLLFRIYFCMKIKTFWGERMSVIIPERVSMHLYRYGFFEKDLSRILIKHLKMDMTFFDIGAHFGYYSLFASYIVGDKGKVYSFEPTPSTFSVLKNNTRNKKNVFVNNVAVFSSRKRIQINDYGVRFSAFNSIYNAGVSERSMKKLAHKQYEIEAISIDGYIEENKIKPDFIKIDAERAEYEILLGMVRTIEKYHPMITVEVGDFEVGCDQMSKELVYFLIERGYDVYECREGKIIPHTPKNNYSYSNLLFLPR